MDFIEGFLRDTVFPNKNIISLQEEGVAVSYLANSSFGAETALVLDEPPEGGKYWILLGDHRKAYTDAFKKGGIIAMRAYFKANLRQASPWSEDDNDQEHRA